jgi:hypothetical protein
LNARPKGQQKCNKCGKKQDKNQFVAGRSTCKTCRNEADKARRREKFGERSEGRQKKKFQRPLNVRSERAPIPADVFSERASLESYVEQQFRETSDTHGLIVEAAKAALKSAIASGEISTINQAQAALSKANKDKEHSLFVWIKDLKLFGALRDRDRATPFTFNFQRNAPAPNIVASDIPPETNVDLKEGMDADGLEAPKLATIADVPGNG